MAVRTEQLFFHRKTGSTAAEGPTTRYTVPAGKTTIVKWLTVSAFGAGTPFVIVYAGPESPAQTIYLASALAAAGVVHVPLWYVLEPGETLRTFVQLVNSTDIVWISAHGAELAGVSS